MTRMIIAEVRCVCGKSINIRHREKTRGQAKGVICWNCNRAIVFQNNKAYTVKSGETVQLKVHIVMDEVLRNNGN